MRSPRTHPRSPSGRSFIACLVALLGLAWPAAQSVAAGVTSIGFEESVLRDLGLGVDATGSAPAELAGQVGFAAPDSDSLRFTAPDGDFEGFAGGSLRHTGALALRFGGSTHDLSGFELRVAGGPGELALFDAEGRRWLLFQSPQPLVADGELQLKNVDVTLAPELAAALGRRDLAGAYVGSAHVRIPATAAATATASGDGGSGQGDPCADVFTSDRDVSLIDVGTVSQLARTPAGPVALTFSARLRNSGTSAILWKASIEPDAAPADIGEHPFLALHLYRIANGRITQIGRSDIKHAFFSTNTNCPCAGAHVIYPTCEDTYGASTNANRLYLAPREEVSVATGTWSRVGSHFDGTPVDDFRHHGGVSHDDFEHRLLVDESELQAGGAYFVEAWYLIRDDVDLFNSMGHDPVTPGFGGSTWSFSTTGAITNGSILDEFVDPVSPPAGSANNVVDTGEGRIQIAVSTSDLGGGQFHYEYAVMNFDFDRQIRSFRIPLVPGLDVSNVDFRDADVISGNDWTADVGGYALTWTAPVGNEMDWGTLYSFGFDAVAAPVAATSNLGVLEPGSPEMVQVAVFGPTAGAVIPAYPQPLWIAAALLVTAAFVMRRRAAAR